MAELFTILRFYQSVIHAPTREQHYNDNFRECMLPVASTDCCEGWMMIALSLVSTCLERVYANKGRRVVTVFWCFLHSC